MNQPSLAAGRMSAGDHLCKSAGREKSEVERAIRESAAFAARGTRSHRFIPQLTRDVFEFEDLLHPFQSP